MHIHTLFNTFPPKKQESPIRKLAWGIKITIFSLVAYISVVLTHEGFLREEYEERAAAITTQAQERLDLQSIDSVAYWAVKARNDLKVEIREKGNPITQRLAEQRNTKKYGNPIGPSYQFLENELVKKGISKENVSKEIIKSAGMANKAVSADARNMKLWGIGFLIGYWLVVFFRAANLPQPHQRPRFVLSEAFIFALQVLGGAVGVWLFSQIDILKDTETDTYVASIFGIALCCVPLVIGVNIVITLIFRSDNSSQKIHKT